MADGARCEYLIVVLITLPLRTGAFDGGQFGEYKHYTPFLAELKRQRCDAATVIDLNLILFVMGSLSSRHRALRLQFNDHGPFFAKARVEHVWRHVPFLDMDAYAKHVQQYGIPVVQDDEAIAPPGLDVRDFIMLNECSEAFTFGSQKWVEDAVSLAVPVFSSLGVPAEVLVAGDSELIHSHFRARDIHRSK